MYYIYKITNKVNGKTYIGQHKYKDLNDDYMGSGILITRAEQKYGIENFEKEILYSRIQYKETVDVMEIFAIAKERAIGKAEYNIADGGQGGAGFHHTEEHKRYMSKKMKGRYVSEETRRKLSKANKGKHHTEESKRKISEKQKGKLISKETLRKLSESHKGQTAWNKGLKGKHWYNNGEVSVQCFECPDGFVKGRICKLVDGKKVYF